MQRLTSRLPLPWKHAQTRQSTNIAGGSMGQKWAEKEHAAESQYFNKKDAELLAKLADKLHNHTKQPSPEQVAKHRSNILALFEKHSVQPVDALIDDVRFFFFLFLIFVILSIS